MLVSYKSASRLCGYYLIMSEVAHASDPLAQASRRLWKDLTLYTAVFQKTRWFEHHHSCFSSQIHELVMLFETQECSAGIGPPRAHVWSAWWPSSKTPALLRISFLQSRAIHGLCFGTLAEEFTTVVTLLKPRVNGWLNLGATLRKHVRGLRGEGKNNVPHLLHCSVPKKSRFNRKEI